MERFANRSAAGQALAAVLSGKDYDDPVVLALPRGGVPVAIEIVRKLKAPLDLIMVRKIGVPSQPELAAAAIVNDDDPQTVINTEIARAFNLTQERLSELADQQLLEIQRRRRTYLGNRKPVPVKGRTAIVVDDGIATGATIRASLKALKRRGPARIVLAVPVAARESLAQLRGDVDDIVCLQMPEPFWAIGAHYVNFTQTSDSEVIRLLAEAESLT